MNLRRLSKSLVKPVVIILVLAMCIGLFYAFPRLGGTDDSYLYKGPSVRVNGVKVKDKEFNDIYIRFLQQFSSSMSEEEMKERTLEYLIDQEIIKQAIKARKITVSNQEIDDLLTKIKIYNQIDTEEEMQMLIKQVGTKNLKELKEVLRQILAEQKLYVDLGKELEIEVTDEEIVEAYEQIDLSHILIATSSLVKENPLSEREAFKKAEDIFKKLNAGGDFEALAKEFSDDLSNKDQGGHLGNANIVYYKSAFVPEFIEAALKLDSGEFSAPVKTQFGYHIIKVIDKQLAEGEEWEQEKMKISDEIFSRKFQSEKRADWLKDEREKTATIEILDPMLLGYHLQLKEKWNEAALAYEKALKDKRYKKDLKTFLSLAEAYKQASNYDAALDVFLRLPERFKDDYQVYLVKAEIYKAKGDQEQAKEALLGAEKKAGDEIYLLKQVLVKMNELEFTEEAKTLEDKIAVIQARIDKEQEEFNKLLQEEQEKIETHNQEGITEE